MFDNAFFSEWDQVQAGFVKTLWIFLFSVVLATVLGTILGSFRVSPIPSLRAAGTTYVNVFRNTPLVLVLLLSVAVIPTLGFNDLGFSFGLYRFNTFEVMGIVGLAVYTSAFVCEAVRSGVNSVPAGQAEAARSIGMDFVQALRMVVLPQAFRVIVPPLTSIYIALAKNTSVLATVGVAEAAFVMKKLGNQFTSDIYWIFVGFALGYVVLVLLLSAVANVIERKLAVSR
ncbi:MAG TPA: amino acid ABC transporter permease [Nocardioidaceae bacterium]|nr:amino acid ABC transporter permease [Nocardioidaceae bacterium]